MKKLLFLLSLSLVLCACELNVQTDKTTAQTTETTLVETTVAETITVETVDDNKERYAEMLAEHIIGYAFVLDINNQKSYSIAEEFFYFLSSLCLYDENAEHPYSDMISLSEDGMFFEISPKDAHYMNLHTFRISDFESTKYYKELLDINAGCLRIPNGIGINKTSYACVDIETRTENGQIIVEFNLVDGYSGFEEEAHNDLGRCYLAFSEDDLILLDFGYIEMPVKDTPYVISERGYWGSPVKYEFTEDGGMLIKYNNDTEEYYNRDGLHYKSMFYDENEIFSGKTFYTYDENGLLLTP